jgi:hypothetical protein
MIMLPGLTFTSKGNLLFSKKGVGFEPEVKVGGVIHLNNALRNVSSFNGENFYVKYILTNQG